MRKLRTQEQIMANWKGDPDKPLVSICCITYNHENFIEDALEGFLIQETDFPFEIQINDDASTDKTAEIIREYETAYPKLLKPTYQTQNQYSQGKEPFIDLLLPKAKGKYIAVCEGDDYWTDPRKLQVQIEAMFRHPECKISFHSAIAKFFDLSAPEYVICEKPITEKVIHAQRIMLTSGKYMPTATLMFVKDSLLNIPSWSRQCPGGDTMLKIFCSLNAGAIFLPQMMSVYRKNVPGSWTKTCWSKDSYKIKRARQYDKFWKRFKNEFPAYKGIASRLMVSKWLKLGIYLLQQKKILDGMGCFANSLKSPYIFFSESFAILRRQLCKLNIAKSEIK